MNIRKNKEIQAENCKEYTKYRQKAAVRLCSLAFRYIWLTLRFGWQTLWDDPLAGSEVGNI